MIYLKPWEQYSNHRHIRNNLYNISILLIFRLNWVETLDRKERWVAYCQNESSEYVYSLEEAKNAADILALNRGYLLLTEQQANLL